ncbi:XRE family transcriptional regulator [Streptacidiphilus sp. 4-A2]|nr:XRE family transcriptional regulator [Streptacidiphilus sp. 4-A2]
MPFDPAAAFTARRALGLSAALVARDMAAHGVHVAPPQVIAWESGELLPSEGELVALARTLWCDPGVLMGGRARSVRDHRLATGMPQEELARRVGLTPRAYAQLESAPLWEGDEAQTVALAEALWLTPYGLALATGREDAIREVLQRAVDGRWSAQVGPLLRLVPTLHRGHVEQALRVLHDEGHASGAMWGAVQAVEASPAGEPPSLFDRFWRLLPEPEEQAG